MLTTLPFEIQTLVVSFLDYHSLIDLLKTGRHFCKLITKKRIKAALWALEQESSDGCFGPGLISKTEFLCDMSSAARHLICYECLRGLPRTKYFLPYQIADNYALGAKYAPRRRCAGCTDKRATWIESSELFCAEGVVFIDCARCRTTTRHESRESSKIAWSTGKRCFNCYKMLVFESLAALGSETFKNAMAEEADWNLLDISIILFGGLTFSPRFESLGLTDRQMPVAKSVISRVPGLAEFAGAELGKPGENTPEQVFGLSIYRMIHAPYHQRR